MARARRRGRRRQPGARASASAVSSTSLTPPWNAAGTARQQRPGQRRRQRQRAGARPSPLTSRAGIERALDQSRARARSSIPRQNGSSAASARPAAHARQAAAPSAATRCPRGRQHGRLARGRSPPRRRQIRHQDAPRHPVHREMVDHQQQTARHDPHRRRTTPPAPSRPAGRSRSSAACACAATATRSASSLSPRASTRCRQSGRRDRTGRGDLQAPVVPPAARQPQPQRVVMVEHRLQRPRRARPRAQLRRDLQQQRLAEPVDRSAALVQPAHDRRHRHAADAAVGQRRRAGPGRPRHRRPAGATVWCSKTVPRRRPPGPPAGPAHQLDRHDAVAAQREEVVVDPDPLQAQHLGEQRTNTRARSWRRPPPLTRAPALAACAPASSMRGRRSRSPS